MTYVFYAIYGLWSFAIELFLCLRLQSKIGDSGTFRINKFHVAKFLGGQLARADLFTDILMIVTLYQCHIRPLLIASLVIISVSLLYPSIMYLRLAFKDYCHLLPNIERNTKLAYIAEFQALAMVLDSFSLRNFESLGHKTVTIPKIVAVLKCVIEDMPQFFIQILYLTKY